VVLAAEEVVEADLVEARRRGIRGEVAAEADVELLARETMTAAFQRMMRRICSSSCSLPGK